MGSTTQQASRITGRRSKVVYFVLEGLNSFSTVQYLYYFYFFTEKAFGFGTKANLAAAALNGGLTAIGAFFGGRLAQRHGYHKALKLGFFIMMVSLAIGSQLSSAAAHLIVMSTMVLGMCLTWPTLEALVSEDEPKGRLEGVVGLYNVVWASTGALAYFTGGALLERFGLRSIFYVPGAMQLAQLIIVFLLERAQRSGDEAGGGRMAPPHQRGDAESASSVRSRAVPSDVLRLGQPRSGGAGLRALFAGRERRPAPAEQKTFVRMAWLVNPFAYIAINSLVAIIPTLAGRLGLSAAIAGFTCSTWCFARVGSFVVLWFWPGWHYRFRWLGVAYLSLIVSFIALLLSRNLFWLLSAQIVFGAALGLIYYSSLFYSMDFSETKGEHGGIHEAAIGLGNFAGPAVGAVALQAFPGVPHSAALAVTGCLVAGFVGLVAIWRGGKRV
jgi:predicted MFS family arabinose efflux permease